MIDLPVWTSTWGFETCTVAGTVVCYCRFCTRFCTNLAANSDERKEGAKERRRQLIRVLQKKTTYPCTAGGLRVHTIQSILHIHVS